MGLTQSYPIPVIPTLRLWKRQVGSAGFLGSSRFPQGNVWYVNSSSPMALDSGGNPLSPGPRNQGTDPSTPFATLAFAIGGAVTATSTLPATGKTPSGVASNNGDVVIVGAGHIEVMGATAITMALSGVTVIFEGNGLADTAQMQFSNTASQLIISGAGNHFYHPTFYTTVDAVVTAISVTGVDNTFEDVDFFDQPAKATLIQMILTTASRTRIRGYRFHASTTGTQKTTGIRIVGGDGIEFDDICMRGDFSVAVLGNITTAFTNGVFRNMILEDTHSGSTIAWAVLTTSTGSAQNVLCVEAATGTGGITASNVIAMGGNCVTCIPGGAATAMV